MRSMIMQHLGVSILLLGLMGCGKMPQMRQQAYDYAESGRYREALELHERMANRQPENALVLNDYGWTLFMLDSLDASMEKLTRAKELRREGGSVLQRNIEKNLTIAGTFKKVKGHLERGSPERAKELLDDIDGSWKTREMRLKYYALVHEQLGNEYQAREFWRRIVNFYPEGKDHNAFQRLARGRLRD